MPKASEVSVTPAHGQIWRPHLCCRLGKRENLSWRQDNDGRVMMTVDKALTPLTLPPLRHLIAYHNPALYGSDHRCVLGETDLTSEIESM